MSALTQLLAERLASAPEADVRFGYAATDDDGKTVAQVGGIKHQTFWLDGVWANPGDPILVLLVSITRTQHTAVVLGMVRDRAYYVREAIVSAAAAGNKVPITVNGEVIQADYLPNYTPVAGHRVLVLWHGNLPTVLNQLMVAQVSTNAVAPTAPPPAVTEGYDHFRAGDSATWWVQGNVWNSRFGQNVYQGTIEGQNYEGAWFYGGATTKNKGATITRTRIRVPGRLRVGNYNQSQTLSFYLTQENTRGGRPTSVQGPQTFSIPPNYAGDWIDLPVAWGQILADTGGGISIEGSSYVGLYGVGSDADSGTIRQDWKR